MEPFADLVALLRPQAAGTKLIEGAGRWAVRYSRVEQAGFGLVLAGECWLAVDGEAPLRMSAGDFVLLPAAPGFTLASGLDVAPVRREAAASADVRHGDPQGEASFRQLGGYFRFEPANLALLGRLLPGVIHIRAGEAAAGRLARLIALIAEEAVADRPGGGPIVERLIEVLLVEALRFRPEGALPGSGLLAGLADPQLARAIRRLHAEPARAWTVAALAREAGLSRSAFSERFAQTVGSPPMEYLIDWRMALAKDMLRQGGPPLETVAAAVGYQSASAFSTAFRRQVGRPPSQFARAAA